MATFIQCKNCLLETREGDLENGLCPTCTENLTTDIITVAQFRALLQNLPGDYTLRVAGDDIGWIIRDDDDRVLMLDATDWNGPDSLESLRVIKKPAALVESEAR